MPKAASLFLPILMLVASNVFMKFSWYVQGAFLSLATLNCACARALKHGRSSLAP